MPIRALLILFLLILPLSTIAQEGSSVNIKKVVIDPGHGGRDPGAVSPDGKIREKNITLSVALKLGELIKESYPHIEIVYTRDKDVAVPLDQRSIIANKSRADLFLSIHVNSARSRAASGSESFVMGADKSSSNLEVTMLENSVVLLEGEDYQSRYEGFNPNDPESYIIFTLLQNAHLEQSLIMASLVQKQFEKGPIKVNRGIKQAPFLVLWKTGMPSVLIELGFISNSNDSKALSSSKNQERFAQLIFAAFQEYKMQYDKGYNNLDTTTSVNKTLQNQIGNSPQNQIKNGPHYRIQIFSISKIVPSNSSEFKGEKEISYIKVGSSFKYTKGFYPTLEEAKKARERLKEKFPQAFIIKVSNGQIIPL